MKAVVPDIDLDLHRRELDRLEEELKAAAETSSLPATPSARDALHDLLLRIRRSRGFDAT